MKTRTITLGWQDIMFEIDKLSLSYSEASGVEDPTRTDRIATETAKPSEARIIRRLCDSREADVLQAMQKFLATPVSATADDTLKTGDYTITLEVTEEVEDNTLDKIAAQAHQYIICGTLADYYAHIGVQGNRESLQMRADAALKAVRELIYYRPMP